MLNKIIFYGVCNSNNKLPGDKLIAPHVIKVVLTPQSESIRNSSDYGKFLTTPGYFFRGPTPDLVSTDRVMLYLETYSTRRGCLGKLAGVIHRIVEIFRAFVWKESIQIEAQVQIREILLQVQILNGQVTRETLNQESLQEREKRYEVLYREADLILNKMLKIYNSLV